MLPGKPLVAVVAMIIIGASGARLCAQETPASNWLAALSDAQDPIDVPSTAASPSPPSTKPASPQGWPQRLLMEWLDAAGARKAMDACGVRAYGSVETGFMGRLTGGQEVLPGRLFDARRPNNLRLHQLWLTIERPYDKKKTFDAGWRTDLIYGGDAFWTRTEGLDGMGEGNGENWFDPYQFYGQLWFRTGKHRGLELQVGRVSTPTGYETTEAALNPLYSHGYLFNYVGPATITGVIAHYYFSPEWSSYVGVVNGWDDFRDNNHAHSYLAGAGWTSREQVAGHARSTFLLNFITGPEQPHNVSDFTTVFDIVATHWWTPKLSQSINADYETVERRAPGEERASLYGLAHYVSYEFNEKLTGVWRAEWVRDSGFVHLAGSPTSASFANLYEMTWGVRITPCPDDHFMRNLTLRPEFRWDFADAPIFGGGRDYQLTLGMDVVFKF